MPKVRFGRYAVNLPENRLGRMAIGVVLVVGGLLGFLPILGFWMVPLGLIVLATDIPTVRRLNRRVLVAVKRWWNGTRDRRKSMTR